MVRFDVDKIANTDEVISVQTGAKIEYYITMLSHS